MTNESNRLGYLLGYIEKEAGGLIDAGAKAVVGAGGALADIAKTMAPYILMAPAGIGLAAGVAHAKATSPSKLDEEAIQKEMEKQELEQIIANTARIRAHRRLQQKLRDKQMKENPRELHV